ncbi:MAG: ATP-grasp domain-containing protein, partial [Leptolyngbyaceae cyanobacterium SL_7_1]|nr:ATP-grasp domain-containing protein [Leptolyngbyaceae cyanobacterium SL_7_1]
MNRVGVIGGGQLAWMMAGAAQTLALELVVQTPSGADPAVAIADGVVLGAIADAVATRQLATQCDVITFENEFVDLPALSHLADQGVEFRPRLSSLAPLLDKYDQHSYLRDLELPVPIFVELDEAAAIALPAPLTFPLVAKARRHGYDGQGTHLIRDQAALMDCWQPGGADR